MFTSSHSYCFGYERVFSFAYPTNGQVQCQHIHSVRMWEKHDEIHANNKSEWINEFTIVMMTIQVQRCACMCVCVCLKVKNGDSLWNSRDLLWNSYIFGQIGHLTLEFSKKCDAIQQNWTKPNRKRWFLDRKI